MLSQVLAIFISIVIVVLLALRFGGDSFRAKLGLSTSADFLKKTGRVTDAIHQYRTAGNFAAEASLLGQIGSYEEAAKVYIRLQDWLKASEMFSLLEDWEMAALYAKKAGDMDAAITAFRKTNTPLRTAQMLADVGLEKEAAELFLEGNDLSKAVQYFKKAGIPEKGLEIMAKEYLRLEQYDRCADVLLQLDRKQDALQVYEKGGNYEALGKILEETGQIESAAKNFARAGLFLRAGSLYEKNEDFRSAARLFLQGGFSKKAFEILEQEGEWFEISRICLLLGKREEALHFMGKIEPDNSLFFESRILFANYHVSEDCLDEAILCVEQGLEKVGVSVETKETAFFLVDLYCRAHYFEKAKALAKTLHSESLVTKEELKDLVALESQLANRATIRNEESSPPEDVLLGRLTLPKIERYYIEKELGRGTQGIVYLAIDQILNRKVVLKMLRDDSLRNEAARRYFLREAQMSAALNHPNVVTLYDLGEVDGQPFSAMEYVEGITLERFLENQESPLGFDQINKIFEGLANALDVAAQHGIVHRDVKPENIMIMEDGMVKLMDFGLARGWIESPEQSTILVGTPFYMSPEQIVGDPIDHRSDLYSLGIILYRMCTGVLPFTEGNILRLQRLEIPPDPTVLRKDLSDIRRKVIHKLLEKKPQDRFDSSLIAYKIFVDDRVEPDIFKTDSSHTPLNKQSFEENGFNLNEKKPEMNSFDPFSNENPLRKEADESNIEAYPVESNITLVPYSKKKVIDEESNKEEQNPKD
jgi:serine/threonine protein kinase